MKRRRLFPMALFGVVLVWHVGLSGSAFGLDPAKSIFQFNCRNWSRQSGLPADKINTVVQTTDGYIWLGTQNGLVRFDGQEFKVIPVNLPQAQGQEVRQLVRAAEGGLWFSIQDGGFGGYRNQRFIPVGDERWARPAMGAGSILETRDGAVWTGAGMGLGRWAPEKPGTTFFDEGPTKNTISFCEDPAGRVWIGTPEYGLFYWADGKITQMPDDYLSERNIFALAADADGQIWVATEFGLRCYDAHGQFREILPVAVETKALLLDRHGVLWVGTSGQGLARYQDGRLTFLTKVDGLGSDFVTSLCEDAEGSLWVGTRDGLSQLTDVRFPIYSSQEGIFDGSTHAVSASAQGGLWISSAQGVTYFDGRNARRYGQELGMPNTYTKVAFEARNGDLYMEDGDKNLTVLSGNKLRILETGNVWPEALAEDDESILVGVGPTLCRVVDDVLRPYDFDGGPVPEFNWINNLLVARGGVIWAATNNGVFRIQGAHWYHWSITNGLPIDKIHFIVEDEDGAAWVGTAAGLVRLKQDEPKVIKMENGLWDDRIYAIVPDRLGYFWMASGRGIFRVKRRDLNDFADGLSNRVECEAFDGLESMKFTDRTDQGNSGCRTADGRIWFPNPRGVVMIDPAHYYTNEIAPPVHIQEVRLNGAVWERRDQLDLAAGDTRVEFVFAALSFVAPDKVRVRYQLDGFDPEWIEAGSRRSVLFNRLSPGAYTFRVEACNMDGVWNTAGAELSFKVPPPFYETVWFRALGALALVLVLIGAYRWKVRHMKAQQRRLEAQNDVLETKVLKRTEELARANTSLQGEIEQRKGTEVQLKQRTLSLEAEIEERTRMQQEIERVHRTLVETSRKAGMAEVAISVLHNVGNVLNSVNVSVTLLGERLQQSELMHLDRVCDLLRKHRDDVGNFLTHDPQGRKVPAFLETLAQQLVAERRDELQEVGELRRNVEHIKEIVAMQQAYARVSGVMEVLPIVELVEDAIQINAGALTRHKVTLARDYQATPTVEVDKHKVLQVLVNLIRNAKYACDESGRAEKSVTIRVVGVDDRVQITVLDNGVGIPAENMTRIFGHGFTTRKDGHGFGLHSGALAAKEMGGSLTAFSDGAGRGARFVLDLPLLSPARASVPAALEVEPNVVGPSS